MCDYCTRYPVFLAFVENERGGMTRLACRIHHDRARTDCRAIGTPDITELHQNVTENQ